MSSTLADTTENHRQKLDESALVSYLLSDPKTGFTDKHQVVVKSFNHGQSNPTYLLELALKSSPGQVVSRLVLRRQPPGKIVSPTAHRVDREFQILEALARSQVPVPRSVSLCTDATVLGGMFYLMEFCPGRCFKDASLPELPSSEERRRVWLSAVDTLATLHDVDVASSKLESFGPQTSDYFARQVRTLTKVSHAQFNVNPDRVPRLVNLERNGREISQRVVAELDEPRVCIVHGDYKMDNLLIDLVEPKVIAVIDWEMSTLGTFGPDLANLLLPFFVPEGSPVAGLLAFQEKESLPSVDELLQRYAEKRKNPTLTFDLLRQRIYLYVAFQFFKNSVILQGVAARSARGQASSAQAEFVGSLAPLLDRLAADLLDKFIALSSSRI